MFFHPRHVVPALKFIAAAAKFANHSVAEVAVKIDAVVGEGNVVDFRHTDAGAESLDVLGAADAFDGVVESTADTVFAAVFVDVYGCLCAPVVGGTPDKGTGVGVAQDDAAIFGNKVRIACKGMDDAPPKFTDSRNDGFKADGCFFNIRGVDG